MDGPVDWYPARILRGRQHVDGPLNASNSFALVILNQPLRDVPTLTRLWQNSFFRVAADGGANRLLDVCQSGGGDEDGIFDKLDVIIGDLDSLAPAARDYFASRPRPAQIIRDPDQYSTDFGKAVRNVRSSFAGAVDIIVMGGLGGRVDQGLSQLHHLYLFQTDPKYSEGRVFLVSGESMTFLLKTGKHRIRVRERDPDASISGDMFEKYVGIIPVKEPSVITTKGLEWDVTDWKTELGGQVSTSNHVLPETEVVEIQTNKDVLFTIALKK